MTPVIPINAMIKFNLGDMLMGQWSPTWLSIFNWAGKTKAKTSKRSQLERGSTQLELSQPTYKIL